MTPNITLYRKDGACSFIPHALLNELNIPYSTVVLKLEDGYMVAADGSFNNEEYKKIHPSGYVPALEVDGQIITELPAIVTYITELRPEYQLFGTSSLERAKANELMAWVSGSLHIGYAQLWRSRRFTDGNVEEVHKAISEKGRKTIMNCYDKIEQRLEGLHAVGGRFTVIDVILYNYWRWGAFRIGIDLEDFKKMYPKYAKLASGIASMESVKKTLSAEVLPSGF